MRLTPLDIRKQEFTHGFRGYDAEEVHAFLQMVANQWEEVQDESRRRDEKIRELQNKMAHYEKVEEALQEALQTARESSRNTLQNAEEKAEMIISQAESRADDIKREAEEKRRELKRETVKLSGRRSEIVTRLRAFLTSEMELLARYEEEGPAGYEPLKFDVENVRGSADRREEADEEMVRPRREDESSLVDGPVPRHDAAEGRVGADTRRDAAGREGDSGGEAVRPEADPGSGADTAQRPPSDAAVWPAPPQTAGEAPVERPDPRQERPEGEEPHEEHGWTTRAFVSRPGEPSAPPSESGETARGEQPPEDESSADERESSEEIEKIRRILSDLD